MILKSFRLVMLTLFVPLLFTNFENTTLGSFPKEIISVIGSLLSIVPNFHFVIFECQIIVHVDFMFINLVKIIIC